MIALRVVLTVATLAIVHLVGLSAVAVLLYACQRHSMIANTILRISPVLASASSAVNSEKDAIGTEMVVPFSDQFAIQVVGVLSKLICVTSYVMIEL